MSELYYLATGSRYFYSSIRCHISPKPSPPCLFFFFFLTNSKQIEHTEQVSALDSSSQEEEVALAAFLSCMEIKPVPHQISNPLYSREVGCQLSGYWVIFFFFFGFGFLFCFVNCQCIRRQITF